MGKKISLKPKGSKGEQKIATMLTKAGIPFVREHKITDLNNGLMRFDFWLLGRKWVVEVNGMQHYQYTPHFHKNKTDFTKACERDRQKISYCLARDYKMYIIPYWDLDELNIAPDIFQDKYLVKSKWHNDNVWRKRNSKK